MGSEMCIRDRRKFAGFQIGEISFGNLSARQIILSGFAENGFLQRSQAASAEPQFIDAARGMQQIEVRHIRYMRPDAVHHHARFQQRQIKALSVKRDERIRPCGQCSDFAEDVRLLCVISHDVLANDHAARFNPSHADFKGNRSRAAAEYCARKLGWHRIECTTTVDGQKTIRTPEDIQSEVMAYLERILS